MATDNKAVMCYLPDSLEAFVSKYCEDNKLMSTRDGVESPRLGTGIIRILDNVMKGNKTFVESKTVKDSFPLPDVEQLVKDQVNEAINKLTSDLEKKRQPDTTTSELIKKQVGEAVTKAIAPMARDIETLKRAVGGVVVKPEAISTSHPGQLTLLTVETEPTTKAIAPLAEEIEDVKNDITVSATPAQANLLKPRVSKRSRGKELDEIKVMVENREGLKGAELSKFLGLKSRSGITDHLQKGLAHFQKWSKDNDPDKKPWRFEGEGEQRRFYRVDWDTSANCAT